MATKTRNPTSDDAVTGTVSGTPDIRYQSVDDHPDSTGNDYLDFGTAASYITFGFTAFDVPAGATDISVQVIYYIKDASTTGTNNTRARLKIGGNYYNFGSSHNPSSQYVLTTDDFGATNPASSSAWTVDDVNGVGAN